MTGVSQAIREKLTAALAPSELDVIDESALHAGHSGARPGGDTHFRIRVVASAFQGRSRVERQRLVYAALEGEIAGGVHALALTTLTPEEAAKR
jgi:BolA protein